MVLFQINFWIEDLFYTYIYIYIYYWCCGQLLIRNYQNNLDTHQTNDVPIEKYYFNYCNISHNYLFLSYNCKFKKIFS